MQKQNTQKSHGERKGTHSYEMDVKHSPGQCKTEERRLVFAPLTTVVLLVEAAEIEEHCICARYSPRLVVFMCDKEFKDTCE
jgi:hypothetical protein